MNAERNERIVEDNLKLVKSLEGIMARASIAEKDKDADELCAAQLESFEKLRRRKLDRIQQENEACYYRGLQSCAWRWPLIVLGRLLQEILKRIEHSKPTISAHKLEEEFEVQEERLQRLSRLVQPFSAKPKGANSSHVSYGSRSPAMQWRDPTDNVSLKF